jgi:hypothetical protein
MEFRCYPDWDRLPGDVEGLFAKGERHSLFLSRDWFETLAMHALDPAERVVLACVIDDDRTLSVLPLRTDPAGNWHSLSTYYASLYSVLLAAGAHDDTLAHLAEGLAGLPIRSLRIEPVADDDRAISALETAMREQGFDSQRLFHFANWSHPLHGESYADYFSGRPSRLRNTIERKRRKLQREHAFEIRLYIDEGLAQGLQDYLAVYRASWKGGERFPGFVPALIRTTSALGWLRLAVLYIDDTPAAAQVWFVAHDRASIFRLAYDERWQGYSPGSLLTAYLMERVIDTDCVTSIDFLTGDEPYKQDWMTVRRERWRLVFDRRPAAPAGIRRLFPGIGQW